MCCLLPGAADPTLNPAKTHAVILGVMEWSSPRIPPFPKQGRQDEVLYQTLLARGLPAENVHYLQDSEASRQAIAQTFSILREKSGPDDTLIFYYSGHGTRQEGVVRFYEYDAEPGQGLTMETLQTLISQNFQGKKVLLLGDCCYSGGLISVSQGLKHRGFDAAAITSALPDALSGPSWTYTMSLIDSLRGARSCDHDLNHKVTLQEVKDEVFAALAYTQRQVMGSSFDGLSQDFVLGFVTGIETRPTLPAPYSAYEYVRMLQPGVWLGARLMGFDPNDGTLAARLQGYNDRTTVWTSPEILRPNPTPPQQQTEGSEGQELASVDGRYQDLLRKIEVPYDYLDYGPLQQDGFQATKVYGQYEDLPDGYWVYLYPYWYIWGTDSEAAGPEGE